jgi:hypothetical protein
MDVSRTLGTGSAILLAAFLLKSIVGTSDVAVAFTETCEAPAVVTIVKTSMKISQNEIGPFEKALADFGRKHGYASGPFTPPGSTKIYFWLEKHGTDQAIKISNQEDPTTAVATMSECGGTKFRPYWEEFLSFLKTYESNRAQMKDNRQ